jgi:hypothetical protein
MATAIREPHTPRKTSSPRSCQSRRSAAHGHPLLGGDERGPITGAGRSAYHAPLTRLWRMSCQYAICGPVSSENHGGSPQVG